MHPLETVIHDYKKYSTLEKWNKKNDIWKKILIYALKFYVQKLS